MISKKACVLGVLLLLTVILGQELYRTASAVVPAGNETQQQAPGLKGIEDSQDARLPVCIVAAKREVNPAKRDFSPQGADSIGREEPTPSDTPADLSGKKSGVSIDQKAGNPHFNSSLDNFNITFLGVENGELQMLTVYSINRENGWKSGTVFVPTDALVPGSAGLSFNQLYHRESPEAIKQVLEKNMEIDIAYYVKVDRNLLLTVEKYIEPIYVGGEKVDIAQLFTQEITPADEVILSSLLKELTEPHVYFGILPKLVWTCKQYLETDFTVTWPNLWTHYQIAKNIDTTKVVKKVLPGRYASLQGKKLIVVDETAWANMVYRVTK